MALDKVIRGINRVVNPRSKPKAKPEPANTSTNTNQGRARAAGRLVPGSGAVSKARDRSRKALEEMGE